MSKSVSDQKVEDVLSSVRRLVSSELPRKPRAAVPEGPGALVLTEAHRVANDRQSKAKSHSLEERIAELEAAVGGQGEEFEPDGSEDQAQHRPDRIVYTRPPSSDEEAALRRSSVRLSQIALIETGPANDDAESASSEGDEQAIEFRRESQSRKHEVAAEAEAPMAEDVPAAPAQSAEVKAFTNPDEVVANIEARIASGRPISEPLPLVEPIVVPGKDAKAEEADDFDDALNKAVAASLASSEGQEDEAEASDDDTEDHASDVLAAEEFNPDIFTADTPDPHVTAAELLADPEDTVTVEAQDNLAAETHSEAAAATVAKEFEASGSAVPEVVSEGETEPQAAPRLQEGAQDAAGNHAATGEAVAALAALPDEEAMRLLVSRMIRDELQGELGERITRNVRKLVRREIKRALTSKDLS